MMFYVVERHFPYITGVYLDWTPEFVPANRYKYFINMKTLVLVCLLSVVWVTLTVAQKVTYVMGPCPNGGKMGSVWYQPGCRKCQCIRDGYNCYSCQPPTYPATCTVTYDNKGYYPDCCQPTVKCPTG
ncbi:uncharacterized protein LOC131928619 [Physella acuta]|uniref:uncharacterized protein LOC131928619 n=1 Tax=Physella acuta TaxID=109671 RepID=UPI0027DE10BA|nr:uncharacterized protein LOC131928619 [Physella acuta]